MNMISTGAFLTEMDASNKQPSVAEKFAAVWEKKNAKAARAGGVSLMALSLAACGGSSSTTTSTSTDTTSTATTTPVTAMSAALTSGTDTVTGTTVGDTITATMSIDSAGTATSTFNALDILDGGDGADSLNFTVTSADMSVTTAAVAQVNTYSLSATGLTSADGATVVIGGSTYTVSTAVGDNALAVGIANAINAHMGSAVAVAAANGTSDATVTVTAPTAGTALPNIQITTDDGGVAELDSLVSTAFTTANVAAVTSTTAVDLTTTATVAAGSVSNVETVQFVNSGGDVTVDASTFTGVTNFVAKDSVGAMTFNDIGTADITIIGNDVVANGNVTFRGSDTASVTDALVINAQGGVQQGVVTSSHANDDWTAVTINSTGGTATATTMANAFTSMDLAGGNSMDTLTVNATSSISTGTITGWDTTGSDANKGAITVTGTATADLGALDAAVESVTASGSSGGVRFTASTQTDFKFVGSSGDDRVTTNAVLSTLDSAAASIDAGAGSADRLILANSNHVTATVGALYKGFEQLQVANGVTVDMDHLSANNSIDAIRLTTGGVVNDMTATQAANVLVTTGGNSPTLTVKGGTTVGQIDTIKLTADDAAAATSTISIATPVLTGVEKLEITATDNLTIAALTSATALDSITGTGAGVISITSGASLGNTNQTINLSSATGDNVVNITGATAAVAVTTGSGADTITLNVDVAHTVNAGGGLDTINIGGSDSADVISTATSNSDADRITSFLTLNNDYDYNGSLSNGAGSSASGIAATEITTATTFAAALAAGSAADDVVYVTTTDVSGATLDTLEGALTAANIAAAEAALVATSGALTGAIANLDTVLGADDAILLALSTDSGSFVIRVTNTDRDTANTLTQDEIAIVAVFDHAADTPLVAGDFI